MASELERRWNVTLQALEQGRADLTELDAQHHPVSGETRNALLAFGERFTDVWNHPACPVEIKKQVARSIIAGAVQATLQRHLANLDLSLERIVAEAARVGTSDIGELFDETGSLLPMAELNQDIRRAIASVKVTVTAAGTERVTEVKLWPKLPGLELVAKLKGLLLDLHLHRGAGGTWEEVLDQMLAERDLGRREAPAAKPLGEGS